MVRRRRVRVQRQRSLVKRVAKVLAMPHLTRRQRAERLAIITAVVLFGVYLILRPIITRFFPDMPKAKPAVRRPAPKAKAK